MVIGLLRVRLHLPLCHSLKEKRSVLKRLIHKLRTSHNCAVAETGDHDFWQSAELSIVTVYAQRDTAESLLKMIEKELCRGEDFELSQQQIEFL